MSGAQNLLARVLRVVRHDLVVLPALAIATVLTVLAGAEIGCRIAYPQTSGDACTVPDPVMGLRFRTNCVSHVKVAEGPWVDNVYNDCGSRSATPCAVPADRRPRLAIFGNSISQGFMVPYSDTYGVRLAQAASVLCHRPIDVQNVARETYDWRTTSLDLEEALQLKPSLLATTVIPFDLETDPEKSVHGPASRAEQSIFKRLSELSSESRALTIAKSLYYANGDNFVKLYMSYGEKANFLRTPLSPFWEARLILFDKLLADLAERANRQKVPVLLIFVPQQAQAMLAGRQTPPAAVAPYQLSERIAALSAKHGIHYVDTTSAFAHAANPSDLYYRVDGHPSPKGQHLIADVALGAITSTPTLRQALCGSIPPAGHSGGGS